MKVQMKISPTTLVECEGQNVQEVFEGVSQLSEIFGHAKCGLCGGTQVRYVVRENQSFKFFEVRCLTPECRARFSFGQPRNVKGGLFPQLKDKDGRWKANGGWEKYEGQKQHDDY